MNRIFCNCTILLIIVLLCLLLIIINKIMIITNILILRWTLRCGVWIVFLLALLGNGCVVFVLSCSRNRIDVPRSVIILIITTIITTIVNIIIEITIITNIIKINMILSSVSSFRFLVCNLAMADFFMGLYLGEQAILSSSKVNLLFVFVFVFVFVKLLNGPLSR